jgi:hypothetical protein
VSRPGSPVRSRIKPAGAAPPTLRRWPDSLRLSASGSNMPVGDTAETPPYCHRAIPAGKIDVDCLGQPLPSGFRLLWQIPELFRLGQTTPYVDSCEY